MKYKSPFERLSAVINKAWSRQDLANIKKMIRICRRGLTSNEVRTLRQWVKGRAKSREFRKATSR